jgi:hypothetical protein
MYLNMLKYPWIIGWTGWRDGLGGQLDKITTPVGNKNQYIRSFHLNQYMLKDDLKEFTYLRKKTYNQNHVQLYLYNNLNTFITYLISYGQKIVQK